MSTYWYKLNSSTMLLLNLVLKMLWSLQKCDLGGFFCWVEQKHLSQQIKTNREPSQTNDKSKTDALVDS